MQHQLSVEEICNKLKPIFGKKIDLIYLKYRLADSPEKKLEIEQALNALYHKQFQNLLTEKILLDPPIQEVISGEYQIATVTYADKELYPFCLRENDFIRHICISGMTGSGKTMLAFQIVSNFIKKNKPFIIFDWKKSFRPLMLLDENIALFTVGNENVSNLFKININIPPKGVNPQEWLNVLCDLITESFFVSYGTNKSLTETLHEAFTDFKVYEGSNNYPTWYQIKDRLQDKLEALKGRKSRESEWLISALRVAHSLTFGSFGEAINYKDKDSVNIDSLFDKKVIFELNALDNVEKKFFCEFLLTFIYKLKKCNQQGILEQFNQAIIVDEAHNIFLKDRPHFIKESVTDAVYREIREYGVSLICLDQHISKLSDTVIGNSACNIAFQQMLAQDIYTVSGLMQIENRKYFSMLPIGYAIVKLADRHYQPFLIKTAFIELKNKPVPDEFVKQKMLDKFTYRNIPYESAKEKIIDIFHESNIQPSQKFLSSYINETLVKYISENLQKFSLEKIKDKLLQSGYSEIDIYNAILQLKNVKINEPKIVNNYENNFEDNFNNLEKKFLQVVANTKNIGITHVYKQLNLSMRKGDKMKNKLIDDNYIILEEIKHEKGWIKTPRLTQKGLQIISSIKK
jgi:predicted transcriptional regulator